MKLKATASPLYSAVIQQTFSFISVLEAATFSFGSDYFSVYFQFHFTFD